MFYPFIYILPIFFHCPPIKIKKSGSIFYVVYYLEKYPTIDSNTINITIATAHHITPVNPRYDAIPIATSINDPITTIYPHSSNVIAISGNITSKSNFKPPSFFFFILWSY